MKLVQIRKLAMLIAYCLIWLLFLRPGLRYISFVIGVILGHLLLVADERYLCSYYNDKISEKISEGDDEQPFQDGSASSFSEIGWLATRSTLFLIALAPTSLFVVSSTPNMGGKGLVLGLMLVLIGEMWELRTRHFLFQQRFLSQLKKEITQTNISVIVFVSTLFFTLINLWLAIAG